VQHVVAAGDRLVPAGIRGEVGGEVLTIAVLERVLELGRRLVKQDKLTDAEGAVDLDAAEARAVLERLAKLR